METWITRPINTVIGWIEVTIGLSTLVGCFVLQSFPFYNIELKPQNVYVFVIVTASASCILGVGMIGQRKWARTLLVFFSGYILLTKLLIYAGLLSFSAPALRIIPSWSKDLISAIYHLAVIVFLTIPYRRMN